jgi:hypothetical protein
MKECYPTPHGVFLGPGFTQRTGDWRSFVVFEKWTKLEKDRGECLSSRVWRGKCAKYMRGGNVKYFRELCESSLVVRVGCTNLTWLTHINLYHGGHSLCKKSQTGFDHLFIFRLDVRQLMFKIWTLCYCQKHCE